MLMRHGFDRASQPPLESAHYRVEAGSDLNSPDHIRTIFGPFLALRVLTNGRECSRMLTKPRRSGCRTESVNY